MKNNKTNKKKSKKKDKEDTLTKILVFIIFIIIVFYVPDLWKKFDLTTQIKRIPWNSRADDNLEAHFYAMEGEEYLFVQGFLRSNCTKLQSENHCPQKVMKANPLIYFDNKTKAFYELDIPTRMKIMNRTSEEVVLELDAVRFVSFVKKDDNSIKFLIQDYLPKPSLCNKKKLYLNGTICPLLWKKKFRINNITPKREDVSVELTKFDIQRKNSSVEAQIQGRVKGNLIEPMLEVRVYNYVMEHPSTLKKREIINLSQKDDYYTFNIKIIILTPKLRVAYSGTDEEGELIDETEEKLERDAILLLFQDQDYFYAEERIMQRDEIIEKTYK